MRGHVVDAVVFTGQDHVAVLHDGHPSRQAKVRVRPLVDLVGHGDEDSQCEDITLPGIGLR